MKIALIGKSGTGKSEVAKCIKGASDCQLIKTGAICRQISSMIFGNEHKSSLQRLDDLLTQIHPSVFLQASLKSADLTQCFIIDSLRFLTDLEIANGLECKTIRVVADDDIRLIRLEQRGQTFNPCTDSKHRTETELDLVKVDFEIVNNGSFELLHSQVASVIKNL